MLESKRAARAQEQQDALLVGVSRSVTPLHTDIVAPTHEGSIILTLPLHL